MFSPDAASLPHSHSLRPKRSRHAGPDDSIKLPRAKRQRSALRRDTFEPLTDASLNEVAGQSKGAAALNGDSKEKKAVPIGTLGPSKPLTLRGGKKSDKRLDKGNGTLLLVLLAVLY